METVYKAFHFLGDIGNIIAVDRDASFKWFKQTDDQFHQGRFGRTVLSDDGDQLATWNTEVQIFYGVRFISSIGEIKVFNFYHFFHSNLSYRLNISQINIS